jgi:hypothetical protein
MHEVPLGQLLGGLLGQVLDQLLDQLLLELGLEELGDGLLTTDGGLTLGREGTLLPDGGLPLPDDELLGLPPELDDRPQPV